MAGKLPQSVPGRNGSDGGQADQLDERRTLKTQTASLWQEQRPFRLRCPLAGTTAFSLRFPVLSTGGFVPPRPDATRFPVVLDLL